MALLFRPYTDRDRASCLSVFQSNIPRYFRQHEQPSFEDFLDSSGCPYFVIERSGSLIACGGYGVRKGSDQADLCWGIVTAAEQGRGLGEYLLLGRLAEIVGHVGVSSARLGTCQLTDGFFAKYGFVVVDRQPEAIAAGLDAVEMRLELNGARRQWIVRRWQEVSARDADRSDAPGAGGSADRE
jgi:hypothetical protein